MLKSPPHSRVICCHVAAHAAVRATPETVAQWRKQPPPITGQPLPGSFLKHSEDQTIVALVAVHQAIVSRNWSPQTFTEWGAIAAPNFLGRCSQAHSVQRYAQEGAWGVSPHLIPHHSLHAVSGTISQCLKIHGPNFGISGGPRSTNDGFLIAATMLAEGNVPGVWLILTGHDREWIPVENGKSPESTPSPLCQAVAMALVSAADTDGGLSLRIGTETVRDDRDEFTLSALVAVLNQTEWPSAAAWRMPGAGWIELEMGR